MIRTLTNIKDFLTPEYSEQMKFSTRNITCHNVIFLDRWEKDKDGVSQPVLHVFSTGGIWIGTIKNPDYIPKAD